MFLLDLIRGLEAEAVPYILVGGYALALQGIVRSTVDIDLVVSLKGPDLERAEAVLKKMGLTSRLPIRAQDISRFHREYRRERNLIAWSFVDYKNPTRQVDLLIEPSIREVKSELISIHGLKIRVATKSSLLKMKRQSNRAEDQGDIVRLEEVLKNEKK